MLKRSVLVLMVLAGCGDNTESDVPPVFASSNIEMSVAENGTIAIDAAASDPEGRPLTYTSTTPQHGTLSGTAPNYTYSPNTGFSGEDAFTITVSNGVAELAIPVHIVVHHVNAAPVAADQQVMTYLLTPVDITLGASDPDSPSLTYAVVDAPAKGTLTGTPPAVTYTPGDGVYRTSDSFTFTASDGDKTSNLATVTVLIGGCSPWVARGVVLCAAEP